MFLKMHFHTLQSIINEVNYICKQDDKMDWGSDEKQQLESQIILANHPLLCLDPNKNAGRLASKINHNRQLFNTYRLKKAARKFSQVSINRKRKLDQFTHRPGLELLDYLQKVKSKHKKPNKKICEEVKSLAVPTLDVPNLTSPCTVNINEFKSFKRTRETSDCLPQLIEEYVLETDMPPKGNDKPRVYHIKLSILQRPSNLEYLGELYLDRDHQTGVRNGVACQFSLGTRANASRYVNQFTEIFTEGGRKALRNCKDRSGQQQNVVPTVSFWLSILCQNGLKYVNYTLYHVFRKELRQQYTMGYTVRPKSDGSGSDFLHSVCIVNLLEN